MMKIGDALEGVVRLGLDTAPIIYLVENHALYAPLVDAVIDYIDQGKIEGLTSTLSLTEAIVLPKKLGDVLTEQAFKILLAGSRNFTMRPIGEIEAEIAADLRARFNLRTPDALQIGTALAQGCDAFLTNDHDLRRVTDLSIIVLDDLEL